MSADGCGEVHIDAEIDIVTIRRTVREVTAELGFGSTDTTRIVTAASELARNVYKYADSGTMRWARIAANGRPGIELVFEDRGPGIADVDQAMVEGYTSSNGLGMGLPGAKRLMDELSVSSDPGVGTTVTVRKWMRG